MKSLLAIALALSASLVLGSAYAAKPPGTPVGNGTSLDGLSTNVDGIDVNVLHSIELAHGAIVDFTK